MLILNGTIGDFLSITTDSSSDIRVHASWVDYASGVISPNRTNTAAITTATGLTIVDSPASGAYRNVQLLNVRNNHATVACTVQIDTSNGSTVSLIKVVLLPGEAIVMGSAGLWIHYGPNGGRLTAGKIVASQAEMETATAQNRMVTPGRQQYHPGHPKAWVKCGITGNVLASYNIASVTDVGVGFATAVIDTDFSGVHWAAQVATEREGTVLTVADLRMSNIITSGQAAGTLAMECYDRTAVTALSKDPTAWHMTAQGDQA